MFHSSTFFYSFGSPKKKLRRLLKKKIPPKFLMRKKYVGIASEFQRQQNTVISCCRFVCVKFEIPFTYSCSHKYWKYYSPRTSMHTLRKKYRSFFPFFGWNFPIIYGNLTPENIYSTFSCFLSDFFTIGNSTITFRNIYCFLSNFFRRGIFFLLSSYPFSSFSILTCSFHFFACYYNCGRRN